MKDLKEIFLFFGISFNNFLKYFGTCCLLFFYTLMGIILPFFSKWSLFYKAPYLFYYLIFLLLMFIFLGRLLLRKKLFQLNVKFINFLEGKNQNEKMALNPDETGQIKKSLKGKGILFLWPPLRTAIIILSIKEKYSLDDVTERIKKNSWLFLKWWFYSGYILLFVALPFLLVAVLTTWKFSSLLINMAFGVGLIFIYFLKVSIINPILFLAVQKKVFRLSKDIK